MSVGTELGLPAEKVGRLRRGREGGREGGRG